MNYKLVGPPSRAVDASLPEAYVMHRLYTQGLGGWLSWSGAPDVVARATHKRSALELGARPTGNWRRGAAGLNSPW